MTSESLHFRDIRGNRYRQRLGLACTLAGSAWLTCIEGMSRRITLQATAWVMCRSPVALKAFLPAYLICSKIETFDQSCLTGSEQEHSRHCSTLGGVCYCTSAIKGRYPYYVRGRKCVSDPGAPAGSTSFTALRKAQMPAFLVELHSARNRFLSLPHVGATFHILFHQETRLITVGHGFSKAIRLHHRWRRALRLRCCCALASSSSITLDCLN